MIKNNRNIHGDLRRKRTLLNLEHVNMQSFILTGIIIIILFVSVMCVAAFPNSNVLAGI